MPVHGRTMQKVIRWGQPISLIFCARRPLTTQCTKPEYKLNPFTLWDYRVRKPKFLTISTPIFHPYSKPCYVEPGNPRSCRHYGQSSMSSCTNSHDNDSFGHLLRMRSAHFAPTPQYYWYIALFDRVYLYCCASITYETSYVIVERILIMVQFADF